MHLGALQGHHDVAVLLAVLAGPVLVALPLEKGHNRTQFENMACSPPLKYSYAVIWGLLFFSEDFYPKRLAGNSECD